MAIKTVYLKKKIEDAIYDIYPHTDASVTHYTKGSGAEATSTTVAAELASLAEGLAGVITSAQVDTKISTATTNLYNQIMGLTGKEGETINEAYDTLKEVAEYLAAHGSVVQGFTTDISALKTAVGDATSGLVKDVADLKTAVGDSTSGLTKKVTDLETAVGDSDSGLAKDVATLKTTVGDSTSGLVKDVADNTTDISTLETTVGDANSGLVKDVAELKTKTANAGGVYVVASAPAVADASDNALYVVVDA